MGEMTLTIVIPTADRHAFLNQTIRCLSKEMRHLGKKLDIIIADNASNPPVSHETAGMDFLENITIRRYDDRVSIGESIIRSSRLANTDYVWIFGDDDLVVDGGLRVIVETLQQDQPDYLYINRYIAPLYMKRMLRTEHAVTTPFVESGIGGMEAVRRFNHHPGFITSLIVKRGMFESEDKDFEHLFPGYGFLASLYSRTLTGKMTYISAPLLVQRKGRTLWRESWPIYWLTSVPAMFEWFEQNGVTGAYDEARNEVIRNSVRTALLAKASGIPVLGGFWPSALRHQPLFNKMLFSVIRWLIPRTVAMKVVAIGLRMKEESDENFC